MTALGSWLCDVVRLQKVDPSMWFHSGPQHSKDFSCRKTLQQWTIVCESLLTSASSFWSALLTLRITSFIVNDFTNASFISLLKCDSAPPKCWCVSLRSSSGQHFERASLTGIITGEFFRCVATPMKVSNFFMSKCWLLSSVFSPLSFSSFFFSSLANHCPGLCPDFLRFEKTCGGVRVLPGFNLKIDWKNVDCFHFKFLQCNSLGFFTPLGFLRRKGCCLAHVRTVEQSWANDWVSMCIFLSFLNFFCIWHFQRRNWKDTNIVKQNNWWFCCSFTFHAMHWGSACCCCSVCNNSWWCQWVQLAHKFCPRLDKHIVHWCWVELSLTEIF